MDAHELRKKISVNGNFLKSAKQLPVENGLTDEDNMAEHPMRSMRKIIDKWKQENNVSDDDALKIAEQILQEIREGE